MGVTAMMLMLAVFYNIPRCDLKGFFGLGAAGNGEGFCGLAKVNGGGDGSGGEGSRHGGGDPERIRLRQSAAGSGPRYTQHRDAAEEVRVNDFSFFPLSLLDLTPFFRTNSERTRSSERDPGLEATRKTVRVRPKTREERLADADRGEEQGGDRNVVEEHAHITYLAKEILSYLFSL